MKNAVTQEILKHLLYYDSNSGVFTWRVKPCRRMAVGAIAGSTNAHGHRQIRVEGIVYYAHRLAYLYMTGLWPEKEMDHINGISDDNSWGNLRSATKTINLQNLKTAKCSNKIGLLGVYRVGNKFRARIQVGEKILHIGYYHDPCAAHAAYLNAKRVHHPGCTI